MPHTPLTGTAVRAVALSVVAVTLVSCVSTPERTADTDIRATDDARIIERGRYLVYGAAHCASCHGDVARNSELLQGAEIPLSGGRRFGLGPLGTVVAPNITSDPVAGVGGVSDAALVRALRYGVSHSGRPLLPFMPFAELADSDLEAILSFLRTLPPVSEIAPRNDLSWLGSFAVNVLLEPQGPKAPPPPHVPPQRTAEYGHYLAHTVANCHGCHTRRSKLTGSFIGPAFAGRMRIEESGGTFITPDLTPGPAGVLRFFDEQQFVERFRLRAPLPVQSPMPWAAFARMTDDDLGAIYRYLKTLPPAPASM